MKYFIFILVFICTALYAHDDQTPYLNGYVSSLPPKEAKRVVMRSFDTIIDMYRSSTEEQKLDFLAGLDDFEIELFMEYLREKYPEEFAQLH